MNRQRQLTMTCAAIANQTGDSVEHKFKITYPVWRKQNVIYRGYRTFTVCFTCHTPQKPYEPAEHTGFAMKGEKHSYRGIMCRAAYLFHVLNKYKENMSPEKYGEWLVEEDEGQFTNMIKTFVQIYARCFDIPI